MCQNSENSSRSPRHYLRNLTLFGCGCITGPVLFLVLILGLIIIVSGSFSAKNSLVFSEKSSEPHIGVINISGIICSVNSNSLFSDTSLADSQTICELIKKCADDPAVGAIILKVNSPGGEVVASDDIYHAVLQAKAKGKIVISYMGAMATSGGYYVSAPCNKIIANNLTMTGSIGVIISTIKYYELLDKIGVESESYTSGDKKDILNPARPTSKEEAAIIQEHINLVFNRFVQICADNRPKLTVEKIKSSIIADGRILTAPQALELGLIDQIGYFEDALTSARELANLPENCAVVELHSEKSFFDKILQSNALSSEHNLNVKLPGLNMTGMIQDNGYAYYLPVNF